MSRVKSYGLADLRKRVTEEFIAACLGGDINRMMELLAPDVTAWTDGGGKVPAALRPLRGADKVARWLLGALALPEYESMEFRRVHVNGQPGLLVSIAGIPDAVGCLDIEHSKITAIRLIRNPDKLHNLGL